MAQGLIKKIKPSNQNAKKGKKVLKPKSTTALKTLKMQQKLSAQINNNLEKVMAQRAGACGKLNIIKVDKKADDSKKGKKGKK
ncbi:hypothetical protein ROZALSC1DRAFT_27307 [Rozella allomycis CSF55]|uniref:Uncharacterized protein n=1 Tax=Rozella allomycis (strain CSF55) TaxID=988480 RepID=A0A075B5E9_ROZAC|nr:hypothetical protein O9G_005037 [Rozella allomycis CSF55]RKP21271.1 hypothetical protein ROZALSC1DRAFT_27307 [Rozella allomycis CSF55]|eukprot:EPZ37071.1 hypothetical protein O9G_005037 [Rozella allomycis CSF55]